LTKASLSWYTIKMDSDYYAEESRQLNQNQQEPKEKKTMQIQIIATSVETKPYS